MKKFITIGAFLLFLPVLRAQNGAVSGYCNLGATNALVSADKSTNTLQGIAPSCTVTVYLTGTLTLATIYSNVTGTVLSNPYTASTDGSWIFFSSIANLYDVTLSGGTAPNNYTAPKTITRVAAQFAYAGGVTPIAAGSTLTSAIIAAACPGSTQGAILLPAGIVFSATSLAVPSNCHIQGFGATATTLSCANGSSIASCLDMNAVSGSELSDFAIQCASSPTTCTTALRIRYSTNILLRGMAISGGGYGTGANPRAQIYTEDDDNVTVNRLQLSNSGGVYEWVNGFAGLPSTRISLTNLVDNNAGAADAITWFDCQWCKVGDSFVDEGNQSGSSPTTQDGYAYLLYATNTTYALSSGCTGSGTITCTIPLAGGGTTQLPVGPSFRVLISGVTGGTGAINGTWDALLASATTFTISGAGNTSGASFSSAIIFYPTTNNLWTHLQAKNCAGTCFYMQGADFSSLTAWSAENCAQQQVGTILPTGCVAVNGGNPIVIGNPAHNDTIGPGTANGSGQYCLDFANTVDLSVQGMVCNNATVAGIRLFGGSYNNVNFEIGGLTIDNVPTCIKSAASSTNSGTLSNSVCQNFTTSGIQPSSGGISFRNWKLIAPSYLPCIDDFYSGNGWFDISCSVGFDLFAGSNTKTANLRVGSVASGSQNHAIEFIGAQHIVMNEPIIDTANDGIFFTNSGATQSSDITILHPRIANITSQPAIWDMAPAAITIATSSSTSVTVTTGVTVAAGMGISDYGTSGNGDIPNGTTITLVTGTCSTGCTLTISQSATGTHASDPALLQQAMSSNIRIWDADIQGNLASCPTTSQAFLIYGFQTSDFERTSIGCFGSQGMIDLRGATNGVTINGGTITGGTSALAAVYMPGGVLGPAMNVTVSNLTTAGTLTNSILDHSTGTGNIINNLTNILNGNTLGLTNTSTAVSGPIAASITPVAATVSTCTEQTFNGFKGLQTTQAVIGLTPPSTLGTHLWLGSLRITAASTLAVSFCADATGGTPPSGTWTVAVK